jgi:hypothetical protein
MATGDRLWQQLAADQYGAITHAQLREQGVSGSALRRQMSSGDLIHVTLRIYRVGGTPETWRQQVMTATLAGCVAFGRTAAALWSLDGFRPGVVEVVTTSSWRHEIPGVVVHRTKHLPAADLSRAQGIPATSVSRTLLDVAGVTGERESARAMDDAINKNLVTLPQLLEQLETAGKKGRPGTALYRRLLSTYDVGEVLTESALENEMLEVLKRGGLPPPIVQWEILDRGHELKRVDAAYPDLLIGFEADGREWHIASSDFVRDRRQQNALVALGWLILRFTKEDAYRPWAFLTGTRKALALRLANSELDKRAIAGG